MLNGDHRDLNSVQSCSDPLKERIKQMMIDQELVFVGQSELRSITPGYKQKTVDLQLSADEFIRQSAHDLSGKEALGGSFPVVSRNSFQHTASFALNRSLTIAEDTSKRVIEQSSWMGKRPYGSSPDIIDIENPYTSYSNNDKHELDWFFGKNILMGSSQNRTRHVYYGSSSRRPFYDVGLTRQRQTFCNMGFDGDSVATNTSLLHERFKLDLNTVQHEDSPCVSFRPSGIVNQEATAFSAMTEKSCSPCTVVSYVKPTSWKDSNFSSSAAIRGVGQNSVDIAGGKLSRGIKSEVNEGKIVLIDLDSDSGEELCNSGDPKIESVGSTSKLFNGFACEIDMENVRKPFSSSDEKAHSGVLEQRSSESPDSTIHCISSKAAEFDVAEQKAVEILVQISLTKLSYSKVSESEEDDTPQRSSESYEAMVLNMKECGPDDYCASSNATVEVVSEKKDSRYKLKRGTRMKDFQKDVLSSLSTLSRHEIREDINIFEGVIKSREYKRMRTKMADADNWCQPTRNKRSRISRR
ncbi:hypothetical protein vseg_006375 [Gypsophila vaccaria]